MKRLILLTYTFPPLSSGGTPVVMNMCRYLPDNDWEVTVVTVENPKGMKTDPSLLHDLPRDLKVIRVPHGRSGTGTTTTAGITHVNPLSRMVRFVAHNYILIPDRVITWRNQVLPVLKKIIADEKPHAIMSFGPHHSLHLIAISAAKETALPLIPFFGDLWLEDSYVEWPSRFNRLVESLLERNVVRKARGIIATTEASTGYFIDRYENICPPTHVNENAYDPRRIKRADSEVTDPEHLTAGWTGNFFGNHSPGELLEGLEMFYKRNPHSKLRIKMAGSIDPISRKRLNRVPLKDKVTHYGHLKWDKVPPFQKNCDILIGYLNPRRGSHYKNASKTAEYLVSGRTILGIVPEGSMAERIRKPGRGYIVHPDAEQIATTLENMEYQWKTSNLRVPVDYAKIEERFSAVNVMKKTADFLNRMAGP
ncbi:MAG: glycosyltransferase [Candidatus Sabulitectum sp.]|nr:glycosyltransferase [Candidatus Sabulitectum sp.]